MALIYSSIPEGSVLLERLRHDIPFSRLFTFLYPEGNGPFSSSGIDDELDDLTEDGGFGSSPEEIAEHVGELRGELERTERAFPGTAEGRLLFDIDTGILESRLTGELERNGVEAAGNLVIALLYGTKALAPSIFREKDPQLYLVPHPVVQHGSRMLAGVSVENILPDDPDAAPHFREQFEAWRNLYLRAAGRGDVMVVYIE